MKRPTDLAGVEGLQPAALLVEHFVKEFSKKLGREITSVSPATLKTLRDHSRPGNIRELANVVERGGINTRGPVLHLSDTLAEPQTEAHTAHDKTQPFDHPGEPFNAGVGLRALPGQASQLILRPSLRVQQGGNLPLAVSLGRCEFRLRGCQSGLRRAELVNPTGVHVETLAGGSEPNGRAWRRLIRVARLYPLCSLMPPSFNGDLLDRRCRAAPSSPAGIPCSASAG
jgi:hypothetical protein